jgi:hypothetical protein
VGPFRTASALIVRITAVAVGGLMVVAILDATRPAAGTDALADGEDLLLLSAWGIAVALLAWHMLGVIACAAARAWPHRQLLRTWVRWSPALARRAAGLAWGASFALHPALLAAPAPAGAAVVSVDEPVVRAPAAPAAAGVEAAPLPPAPEPLPQPVARTHLVAPGDSLWRIASAELSRVHGRAPSDSDTADYWRAMIDANLPTLRSNDPSLIHPGELVVLPPV